MVHVVQVLALVRREVADLDGFEGCVPPRGVVCATLPGMIDRHEPGPIWVTGCGKVTVPGQELRVDPAQEPAREAFFVSPGQLPDAQGAEGVGRRLAQGTGVRRRG